MADETGQAGETHPPLRNGTHRPGNIYWGNSEPGGPGGQVGYIRIDDLAVAMVRAFNGEAALLAEVERLTGERDEARAKVAGREPKWGVRTTWDSDTADMWHPDRRDADRHIADARRDGIQVTLIRQWRGPVEAVGDGSGT